jgi:hypothetical protein
MDKTRDNNVLTQKYGLACIRNSGLVSNSISKLE